MDNELSYRESMEQLEAIVKKLQSSDCDIDTMVADTRRAAELIKRCREKLVTTETELRQVLQSLQSAQ
ncbi:MAG: exodeoxyribonuclease VII small subunit [Muribaculaceae bacterium]|nr:exodeoxyribonuclease VII small subunit [Muribaculaceae bacterium]